VSVIRHSSCVRRFGRYLLAQVRCAVINGDHTAKLRECKAQSEEPIPENVAWFLEELQRVAA